MVELCSGAAHPSDSESGGWAGCQSAMLWPVDSDGAAGGSLQACKPPCQCASVSSRGCGPPTVRAVTVRNVPWFLLV